MTRLRTAPADKVSGLEFLDALGFSSPERRAERTEQGRKIAAGHEAKTRAAILQMRENICELVKPETAARFREEWALEDALRSGELGLTEIEHLAPGRIAA